VGKKGNILPFACTMCHSILAYEAYNLFKYLEIPDKKSPDYKMHKILRDESFETSPRIDDSFSGNMSKNID
jgi:hypothetical protein